MDVADVDVKKLSTELASTSTTPDLSKDDDAFIGTDEAAENSRQQSDSRRKKDADDDEAKQWGEDAEFGACCRLQSAMRPNYAPTNDNEMVDDFGFVVKKSADLLRGRQEAFITECRAKLELIAQLEFQRIMDTAPSGAAPSTTSTSHILTTKNPSITGVAINANAPPRLQHHLAKTDKLRQLILNKGISHSLRATLWMRLSNAIDKHVQSELSYKDILRQSLSAAAMRRGASMMLINIQKDIERDMPLLLPNEMVYQNLRSPASRRLRNVIDAWMWLYPNIGYKQELAKITAFLLLIVDERDTFWLVCTIIEDMLPASYYTAESLGAQADMLVLEDLLLKSMPDVHEILKRHQLSLSVWMQSWFATLFVGALVPHQPLLLCRFLDWFFLDGSRTIFGFALALIDVERPNIIAAADDAVTVCNIIANAASFSSSPSSSYSTDHLIELAARHASKVFDLENTSSDDEEQRTGDDLLQQMRQNHMGRLMVDAGLISLPANTSSGATGDALNLPKQHVTRRIKQVKPKKKSDSSQPVLFYAANGALLLSGGGGETAAGGGVNVDAKRDKNILQTELIIDLRQAVMSIVKHFQSDPSVRKINCTPDYSPESHFRDREAFVRASKSKFRRARAILDFEATDEDELGFQKNDIITVISQRDDHCWIGELHGGPAALGTSSTTRGWFPARFVELLDERDGQQYSSLGDDSVDERISHLVRNQLCEALKQILLHDIKSPSIIAGKYHPWNFIEDVAEREIQQAIDKRSNDRAVQSRLQLYRAFRLDEDEEGGGVSQYSSRVLSADELMLRAVKAINASHNAFHADDDVKLRTLICLALNEQCLHLWLETLCSAQAILQKWYLPNAFMRSPVWMQIKCELRLLAQLPFTLRHDYELCYSASSGGGGSDSARLGTYNGGEQTESGGRSAVKAASARGVRDAAVKQSVDLLDVSLMRAPSKRNPLKESVRDMLVRYHLFSWELHG